MRRYYLLFILNLLLLILASPLEAASTIQRDDLAAHFGSFQGTFILLDEKNDRCFVYNPLQSKKRLSPASTYKIIHSLIALETGVVESETTIIAWDGRQDTVKPWNQDHSLASAVKYSVVWYFQEIASRVGSERMQAYIDQIPYGNRDISGGLTNFWLDSSLTISALEQVELLRRLYTDALPFSKSNMATVRKILIQSNDDGLIFSGKTGTAGRNGLLTLGWFVGTLETGSDRYFFATNIEAPDNASSTKAREITRAILKEMSLLP